MREGSSGSAFLPDISEASRIEDVGHGKQLAPDYGYSQEAKHRIEEVGQWALMSRWERVKESMCGV